MTDIKQQMTVDLEKLAGNIEALAAAGQAIANSRLTQRAIITLLHDMSKVGKRDIEIILHNLPLLAREYLKPAKKP